MQKITTTIQKIKALKKTKNSKSIMLGLAITLFGSSVANAQFTATGQFRPRTEYRDGYSTLQVNNADAAAFTSQRTRLNVGFTGYRFKFFVAVQDVRVWGQDASTINRVTTAENNGVQLHEAWGEIMLNDTISNIQNLSLKIGRQEISYDDQKVIGGLDWLQQARYHDAIVLKYFNKGWTADFGAAFNQNKELLAGTIYNGVPSATAGYTAGTNALGTNYKSLEYVYLARKFFFGDISFLFLSDNFNKYTNVTAGTPPVTTKVNEEGIWTRNTTGFYYNVNATRKLKFEGSIYHQFGHDKNGRSLSSNLASITSTLQVGRKLFVGPGVDYLSGNDGTEAVTATSTNKQFDPLYGTPHKFWGNMDYFYASSGFGSQGLLNYFLKTKYNLKDNLTLFADLHGFQSANSLSNGAGGEQTSYLGTELDLKISYSLTKMVNIEGGYSFMKATNSMASAQVKNVANASLSPQWAYVMVNIKPNFLNKK
ncbi:alginate export family protein [Flavobacterium sp. 5]|uniref:alginate export family protein n=1 Tax=Flavobacterium sp. 5 TaxID=2035199 RepID=UPI000CB4F60C|nr:alginate export family protein [Flavobacterium sp. 5]PKB16740.1 alginate export protein [Flavobacterium sp. 5]